MKNIYEKLIPLCKSRKNSALCILVSAKGSTPRKIGAKMIVDEDGKIQGTIGGGDLEKKVIENALKTIENKTPQLFRHDLLHQHNMCCGGTVDIYIEPILKKDTLYIFGAGHTGQALAKFANELSFEVVVIDNRKEYLNQIIQPDINKMHL